MFKKVLAIIIAVSFIFAPIAMAKPALDPVGIISSAPSGWEVQYVCDAEGENCIEWLMIEDRMRVKDRTTDAIKAGAGNPSTVLGFWNPEANAYLIFLQFGFITMPIGFLGIDYISAHFPHVAELFNYYIPNKFQTFAGYEDIWWYFSNEGNEDEARDFIRYLNERDLEQYNGNGGM